MKATFSLLFWLKRAKLNNKGESHIYARITVNGKRAELSTHWAISPQAWNINKGRVRGHSEAVRAINVRLDKMALELNQIHAKLVEKKKIISARLIKNTYLGVEEKQHFLFSQYQDLINRIKAQLGTTYSICFITVFCELPFSVLR